MADFGFFLPYAKPLGAAQGVAYEPWHISFAPASGEQRLDPDALALCLQQADIEGKACILSHLDEILARYVTAGHTERRIR